MKRVVIFLFIACGLAGCKSQTPSVDPFFGRTTIPPPATGSIAGQTKDPYYQATPPPLPNPAYSPGLTPSNSSNTPGYSGSIWTRPHLLQSNPGLTSAPSYNPGTTTTAPTTSPSALQPVPQNYPGLNTPPANIPQQAPYTPPGATPSTPAGQSWPGGNRYTPPGGSFNYRGASTGMPNPLGTSPSSKRISTPFFAGGVPNRTSSPLADNSPRPIDDTVENVAGPNQGVPASTITYNPAANPGRSNISLTGRSPSAQTIDPQPKDQSSSSGNSFSSPAARQSSEPDPAQRPNDSVKPAWRESTSFETSDQDGKVEMTSNAEPLDD